MSCPTVTGRERITVSADEFDTFVIQVAGWRTNSNGQVRVEWKIWIDPSISFDIAREFTRRNRSGKLDEMLNTRLVALAEPK